MSMYSSLIPEAHLNHNSFDTSERHVYSVKGGACVPFYFKATVPNAVYDIQVLDRIELNGMPRANFGRMSQQIDFFFVPYSQLWKPFDNTYYQRLDNVRNPGNVYNPLLPTAVPTFDMHQVLDQLIDIFLYSHLLDDVVSLLGRDAQYNDSTLTSIGQAYDDVLNTQPIYWQDVHGRLCIEDMLKNFDLMGYGNFLPLFQLIYKGIIVQYANSVPLSDMIWEKDYIDRNFPDASVAYEGMIRTEQFGTGTSDTLLKNWAVDVISGTDTSSVIDSMWTNKQYHPNAWPILAYLKIYNDYYKSFQYDTENYAYYYNYDWLGNPSVSNEIPTTNILFCLIPRYHLYKRDMFTGGYPNSQFGNVAVTFTDTDFHKLIGNTSPSSVDLDSHQFYSDGAEIGSKVVRERVSSAVGTSILSDKFKFEPALSVSVLALRQAEAMQRWKEKNLRAGDRLKNQQSAFFGDRSRYVEDDYCREIGNTYTPIMIDDVTATSDGAGTENTIKIGEKGAAGSSSHSNNIVRNFESHDFGVIVGIMYILPESEYEAFGFDPMNIKTLPTDYFMPDFQNLGLAPVPNILFDNSAQDRIINYLSRYYEYKTRISKVHGEFNADGAFGDYVTPRNSKDLAQLSLAALQVAPFDIDNLFYSRSNMHQSSDQFKVNMNVVCRDILPMSITGLPY